MENKPNDMDSDAVAVPASLRIEPPVLKRALTDAFDVLNLKSPLGRSIEDLERLLMVNSNAPAMLDAIPLSISIDRSMTLVTVVQKAYATNPNPVLAAMIRRVGSALKEDRTQRGQRGLNGADLPEIVEAASEIKRTVSTPGRPRY